MDLATRVEAAIRRHGLIDPGGGVTCLVSGGADSTCLWHVLGALGYSVRAVHVHHGIRGTEADGDAEHCADAFGAEVIGADARRTEAELRDLRYALTAGRGLRATGHTASDQVETVVYRIVSSGSTRGIRRRRADGVVRPLLAVWRDETEAYCRDNGLAWRTDSTNRSTKRGLIRERLVPLLDELDPRARENLLALGEERPRLPRRLEASLVELVSSLEGTRRPISAAASGRSGGTTRCASKAPSSGARGGSRATCRGSSSARDGREIGSLGARVRCRMCS